MTDERNDRSPEEPPAELNTDVARWVRLAGPRPRMSAARVARMQRELRPVWEGRVVGQGLRRPRLRLLAAAALLVLAIGAAFLTRSLLAPGAIVVAEIERSTGTVTAWRADRAGAGAPLARGTELTSDLALATDEDGRVALAMSTGHSVRLDHGTRIAFLSEREIRLEQGAVYVDSGSHGAAALGIVTALGRVEEIGTQFEVRLHGGGLTVRVREGAVELDAGGQRHEGRAGERLTLSGGVVRRSEIAPSDPTFGWTQDIAPGWQLDGSRLDDFLGWVARESGLEIDYADDSIARDAAGVVLRGDIEGIAPLAALDVVLPAVGFQHRVTDETLRIERR